MLLLKRRLDSSDQISVFLLIVVIAIGLLSNAMSGLAYSWFSVFVDVISETKFLWTIFAFKYYITSDVYGDMSRALRPLAKLFCYLAGLFAIISQFVNLGMTENERYGIKSYNFVFPMSFQFLAVALVAIAVLSISKDKYNNRLPYAAVCVGLILATKSSPLLFSVMFIFLLIYFQKRAQLKTRTVVFMAVVVLLLGTFQIQTYLMNVNIPLCNSAFADFLALRPKFLANDWLKITLYIFNAIFIKIVDSLFLQKVVDRRFPIANHPHIGFVAENTAHLCTRPTDLSSAVLAAQQPQFIDDGLFAQPL